MRTNPSSRRARTAGVALIEVMIAVLLFAIGILGLVGLQAAMTQAQTDSKVRADAANLVDELATLMWADLGTPPVLANLVAYDAGGCAGNVRCSSWVNKLASTLPGGTLASLAFSAATGNLDPTFGQVTVDLRWTLPNASTQHKFIATFNVAANTP